MQDKRPRHYAMECLALPDNESRRRYLETVPAEYRDWVKKYLRDWWPRRKELLEEKP